MFWGIIHYIIILFLRHSYHHEYCMLCTLYLIAFMSVDRTTVQAADVGHTDADEFDTTLHGPWMKRWEIVHHNRHTASMLASTGQEDSYKP